MVSDGIWLDDSGAEVVIVSDTIGCFSLGLEMVPKGMDSEGIWVG